MGLSRQLGVESAEAFECLLAELFAVEVERRVGAVEREHLRLAFEFVAAEKVRPVLDDGAAKGPADLLVRIREHSLLNEVGFVEAAVPEVSGKRPGKDVGARFGNDVQLRAKRATLGGVEPVRDELEFGDGIPAVGGAHAGQELRRDLLSVDIDLVVTPLARVGGRLSARSSPSRPVPSA